MGSLIERKKKIMMMISAPQSNLKKKEFITSSDTMYGDTTLDAIKNELPLNYRYAIALVNDRSLENSIFIAAVFMPWTNNVFGIRWRDENYGYQTIPIMNQRAYDVRIYSGQHITILWTEQALDDNLPTVPWECTLLESSGTTNAFQVYTELADVDEWNVILSVADLDFNTMPSVNNTFCCGALIGKNSYKGQYIRQRNSTYSAVENVNSASYDVIIANGTKLINFYF